MPSLNFIDLAKANSNDVIGGIIEEIQENFPELRIFPLEDLEEPGLLSYETLHRTARPSVQFANAGEGFTPTKSELSLKKHECFRFGSRVEAARHIADNYRKGGAEGYQALEAQGVLEEAFKLLGMQIFYGRNYDGKGFPGLKAFTPLGGAFTVNATGTTASTASSIYFVKFGEEYCQLVAGKARNASGLLELPDFRIGDMEDADGKKMEAYISELSSYVGLQIAAARSVVRIANVTGDVGKGCTDKLLRNALSLFPAGFKPDAIFMSVRSCDQLQDSRTVTLFGQGLGGSAVENQAPRPTVYNSIPIVETDAILNTDAIEV